MIVVVGGIKGGTGKTTIATNLVVLRAEKKKKVLVIDADEQKSVSSWSHQREVDGLKTPWVTVQLSGASLRNQVQKMITNYDDIIIDVGGRDTTSQRSAMTIADAFIVPFQPRSLDIWTIGSVRALISEIASINPTMKSYAVINRGDSTGMDNTQALDILKDCEGLTTIPTIIIQRKAFANAATNGLGVTEMTVKDVKAIAEIKALHQFVYQNGTIQIPK